MMTKDFMVIIVDDQPDFGVTLGALLRQHFDCPIANAVNSDQAIQLVELLTGPAVILLDRNLKNSKIDGIKLASYLRKISRYPIFYVGMSGDDSQKNQINMFRSGITLFCSKLENHELIAAKIIAGMNFVMENVIHSPWDPLTGFYSQGGFKEVLRSELQRAKRVEAIRAEHRRRKIDNGPPVELHLAVLFADVDDLKAINEMYGHEVGTRAILAVANSIENIFARHFEPKCRWGGDEFALLLVGSTREKAEKAQIRLEREVAKKLIKANGSMIGVGVTIGIVVPTINMKVDDVISEVSLVMLEKKRNKKCGG